MCFQLQYIAFDLHNNIALRNAEIYYCHPNQELICVRVSELPPLSKLPRVTLDLMCVEWSIFAKKKKKKLIKGLYML